MEDKGNVIRMYAATRRQRGGFELDVKMWKGLERKRQCALYGVRWLHVIRSCIMDAERKQVVASIAIAF
ncbi:hypothetical protein OUZ56_025077 [Daphnia magna]|uniref:Uncharacterized protein n=1 Tax=Daphnia magna TaxID=35525 RepID=A0ABQ9ZIT5_9CRUS|nr:hypothetical protein OUZ56_025077 [Daphnia magna]